MKNYKSLLTQPFMLWIILGLGLSLRLGLAEWWLWKHPGEFGFGDSGSYWHLAQDIVQGKPYQFGAADELMFRTPGYPILLAGLMWLSGGELSIRAAQYLSVLLGVSTIAGVYALGKMLFDPRSALAAAAMTAFYPGAAALSVFVLSEAPLCPLELLHLGLWIAAWKAFPGRRANALAIAAGVAAGAATMMRPEWLLFTPWMIGCGVLLLSEKKKQLLLGLGVCLGLCLAMLPWWVRNWQVSGRFVMTTSQVGASLYDGLNPEADGGSNMQFVDRILAEEKQNPTGSEDEPLEFRLDRRLKESAIAWAKENPGRVMVLAGKKFLRMWNIWPNEPQFRSWPVKLGMGSTFAVIFAGGLWGAKRFWGMGFPIALCLAPAAYSTLLHVIFVASIRYREPALLPWIALAGGAMCYRGMAGEHDKDLKSQCK